MIQANIIKYFQIGDDSRTRSSTPDVLRPSAGSMSSGSVIGVTSASGMSMTLPPGRASLASEEEDPPETCSLADSIGQCVNDQSPMVRILTSKRQTIGQLFKIRTKLIPFVTCKCFHLREFVCS